MSKYTATINWGNGTTTNATIVTDPSGGGKFDVYGIDPYIAAGTESVTVQINDLGGATTTAPSTATVTASPITASNANPSATAGTPFSGTIATFFDTTPGAAVSNLTTKINWGDGTSGYGAVIQDPTVSGQYDVIGTHTYTTPGSETVSISIKDQNGVYVALERHHGGRRAPIVAVATNPTVTEGQSFSGTVATFTDSNPNEVLADFSATVDYGDGNFSQGTIVSQSGGFAVTGTDTYAGPGPYTTTVTIRDSSGGSATVSGTTSVTVPTPTVSIVATQPSASVTGVNGTFTVTRTGDTTKASQSATL